MYGHKVCGRNEIGGPYRRISEPEVRLSESARFHGVVGKICLSVFLRHQTDGGYGVLIGSHGTVAAQTPYLAGNLIFWSQIYLVVIEGSSCHVVHDSYGEVVLGLFFAEIVEDGFELSRSGVFR